VGEGTMLVAEMVGVVIAKDRERRSERERESRYHK
jgi:hypothetical protein